MPVHEDGRTFRRDFLRTNFEPGFEAMGISARNTYRYIGFFRFPRKAHGAVPIYLPDFLCTNFELNFEPKKNFARSIYRKI